MWHDPHRCEVLPVQIQADVDQLKSRVERLTTALWEKNRRIKDALVELEREEWTFKDTVPSRVLGVTAAILRGTK